LKKLMLIVNPAAGKGSYKVNFGEALNVLDKGGYRTTLYFTSAPGDATDYAKNHANGYDTVACIGGDGRLSEVMAGLMQVDAPPPLGYIPMGTSNDVATTLNLPKNDTVGAAKRILGGEPHPYDVGGFGKGQYFAYIAAFGAFTEASYATPQSQKKALGHLAYVLQGAASLTKLEAIETRIEYDGGVLEDRYIYGSMSNSTSVAGMLRLPEKLVGLGDGMSELFLVRYPDTVDGLADIATALLTQSYDSKYVSFLHTKKAKFSFAKEVAWTRDGEDGGKHLEVELTNYAHALNFIF